MSPQLTHLTKTESALRAIRERIHSGQLPVGTHLLVNELASEMGMSHTPVREALRVLSADGLVEIRSHRGAVVADTADRVGEVWRLRSLLEPEAIEQAVPRLDDQRLSRLETLHAQVLQGPDMLSSTQNKAWHFAIYEACDAPILLSFIRRLWGLVPWRTVWVLPGRSSVSASEHEAVMEAIRAQDARLAAERMREHILSALHSVTTVPGAERDRESEISSTTQK